MLIPRAFNRTLLFINLICSLAMAALLAARETSATVSGTIHDPNAATLPKVNAVLALEDPPHTLFSVRGDQDGRFRFSVLPAGTYTLSVTYRGFKTLKVRSILVTSAEQKILPPLRMDVAPSDRPFLPIAEFALHLTDRQFGNLGGRVMRDESRGVAGATVRLFCGDELCSETKTDASGEFSFFNLPPRDDYAIRVTCPGYHQWQNGDYEVQAGYDATYGAIVLRPRTKLSRAASTVR